MMGPKKPIGITVFGIIYILSGIIFLAGAYGGICTSIFAATGSNFTKAIWLIIAAVLLYISGHLILRLKGPGLKIAPIGLAISILLGGFRFMAVVLLIAHFIFFTRPEIKEQFSRQVN